MKWINIDDKLPDQDKKILFLYFPGCIRSGRYDSKLGFIDELGTQFYARYWMPLPKDPKGWESTLTFKMAPRIAH